MEGGSECENGGAQSKGATAEITNKVRFIIRTTVFTTEAIEIKGSARSVRQPSWCMSMHMAHTPHVEQYYGRVSRSYCLPLISMASVVQFSDPLNHLVGMVFIVYCLGESKAPPVLYIFNTQFFSNDWICAHLHAYQNSLPSRA